MRGHLLRALATSRSDMLQILLGEHLSPRTALHSLHLGVGLQRAIPLDRGLVLTHAFWQTA